MSAQIAPFYYIECQAQCLEINEAVIFAGVHYTPQSNDSQRWYINYLHGQSDESFLIVSKLNGKALYCKGGGDGLQVRASERNEDDDSQHWKRKGSYIISKKLNKAFFMQPNRNIIFLVDRNEDTIWTGNKERVNFAIKNVSPKIDQCMHGSNIGPILKHVHDCCT